MRKKYLSALLFGAMLLASAGTFTSCKDYDDDIDQVNTDINAVKSDLSSKLDAVNTSISGLTSAQSDIKSSVASLNQQIEALKATDAEAAEKLAGQAALLEAQDAQISLILADLEATKASIAATTKKLEEGVANNAKDIKTLNEWAATLEAAVNEKIAGIAGQVSALQLADKELAASLEQVVADMNSAFAEVNKQLAAQETAINTQIAALEAYKKQMEAIELAKDEKIAAADKAIADLNTLLTTNVTTINGQLEGLDDRISALEAGVSEADWKRIKDEIATAKSEITKAYQAADKEITDKLTTIQKTIETNFGKELNALKINVNNLITAVSFDYQYNSYPTITFKNIAEQTTVFGYDVDGNKLASAISFKEGAQQPSQATVTVRVSPASAELKPEMISFVNSKGEVMPKVKAVKTVRYEDTDNGYLTRAAAAPTGIWEVSVELTNYDQKEFEKATLVDPTLGSTWGNYIAYAISVENTLAAEDADVRTVTSRFNANFDYARFVASNRLLFRVDGTKVEALSNRSATGDFEWTGSAQTKENIKSGTTDGTDNVAAGDNRSTFTNYFPAVQGVPFTISLKQAYNDADRSQEAAADVRAMYVTLDKKYATESEGSEWQAWTKAYNYSGLNEVVEGTSINVTINSANAINDIIGFRVYAVNHDGTLVDPDGRAFYVKVGQQAAAWNAANTVIVPDANIATTADTEKSGKAAVTLTKLAGATQMIWSVDAIGNAGAFDVYFEDQNGAVLTSTVSRNVNIDFSKVKKVYTMPRLANWYDYEDGKQYAGKVTIKNADGFVLATLDVTMTKNLPQGVPAGFSVKTAQIVNGIYNCYLIPNNWAAESATAGTMGMNQLFNVGTGVASQYKITFDAANKDAEGKLIPVTVAGDGTLNVAKSYIDNTKKHTTTVVYNYGQITSQKDANGNYINYTQKAVEDFQTIFNCIYNDTYTWNWATRAQLGGAYTAKDANGNYINALPSTTLTYGADYTMRDTNGALMNVDAAIFGTSAWDSRYSKLLSNAYNNSLKITSATLTSDANGVAEYFDVTVAGGHITGFTFKSGATNPTANVPSTLTIKAKDMYGHERVIRLPMTVKKR